MSATPDLDRTLAHRTFAVELFNQTWDLLDLSARTPEQIDAMLHGAHASCYHWAQVGNRQNLSIGEWQISRVYAVLGRAEAAAWHGQRSLDHALVGPEPPFYLGYAHEALARAARLAGDAARLATHLARAQEQLALVTDAESRGMLAADLAELAGD
ncbi:MAG: hypothetical protein IT204_23935 [Fimbriimonadaceae bacterium]|nr:hypothetical protein [Fimbriimonadaceae bacterium]